MTEIPAAATLTPIQDESRVFSKTQKFLCFQLALIYIFHTRNTNSPQMFAKVLVMLTVAKLYQ